MLDLHALPPKTPLCAPPSHYKSAPATTSGIRIKKCGYVLLTAGELLSLKVGCSSIPNTDKSTITVQTPQQPTTHLM